MKKLAVIIKGFLAIFCIAPCKLTAQPECSVQHFNTANGLSQNTITGMAFDKTGYLWLGTQNGLIRYDGINFKTFLSDPNNTGKNNSNTVLNISAIPPDKKVLVRMQDGIVYAIQDGRLLLYSATKKNSSIYYETEGRFPNLSTFDQFNLPATDLINVLKWNSGIRTILPVNKTDFIVLGENDNDLLYYKNGAREKEIQLNCRFRKFLKSGEYNFMVDDKLNLHLYDSLSITFNKIDIDWTGIKKETGKVNDPVFIWDKLNDQSYCFYNSIFYLLRFDTASHVMKFVPRFPMKNEVHSWTNIGYDSTNSIYFLSTYTEGLFQVQLKKIQTFSLNNKTANDTIANNAINYALLKTSDSTVLAANGLEFTNKGNYEITVKKKGNISGNGQTIARLGDTAILSVQNNQLVYYSQSDGFTKTRSFNESFNKNYRSFVTLLQPEGDSVWVCSDLGIFSLKQNNVRALFFRKPDAQSLYFGPHLLYRLSEDALLFSNDFGLFKLRTTPPYTIDTFPEMKDKQVSSIIKYKDVFLLSVYKYGLFVFNGTSFHKVPVSEDQSGLSFCHSAYIDRNENVWVTTDNGLYRSSISVVIESALKKGITSFFFSYDERDGLTNTEFNRGGTPATF